MDPKPVVFDETGHDDGGTQGFAEMPQTSVRRAILLIQNVKTGLPLLCIDLQGLPLEAIEVSYDGVVLKP